MVFRNDKKYSRALLNKAKLVSMQALSFVSRIQSDPCMCILMYSIVLVGPAGPMHATAVPVRQGPPG
jgi:hypothetical protein